MKKALILGSTGGAGRNAKSAFESASWDVRCFNRGSDDLANLAAAADVIVNAWNPANYHNWSEQIPRITKDVIRAAQGTNATVILPGNVYNFGTHPGPWSENTPHRPNTKKGQIRKDIEQMYRTSGVRTIILRAGEFIANDGPNNVIGNLMLAKARKGIFTNMSHRDVRRSYAYLPDWAAAAVQLADMRDQLEIFEDIPYPGHTLSGQDICDALGANGVLIHKHSRFPWWFMTVTSPFWELAREFREMRYLYDTDHALDGTKFKKLLPGFQRTALKKVVMGELPKG